MSESVVTVPDVAALMRRHVALLLAWVCVGSCVGVILTYRLPKEYRSQAVLSIQGNYFQSPMSQDVVAPLSDPREVMSQKMAILRMALSNDFIDRLAELHGLYEFSADSPERNRERELFREKLSFFSTSPTTFQIEVKAGGPLLARSLTSEVLNHMLEVLFESRYRTLFTTREVIDKHVESLKQALKDSPLGTAIGAKSVDELREELGKLDANVAALLVKFTERHPAVLDLRRKQQALMTMVGRAEEGEEKGESEDGSRKKRVPLSSSARAATQEIFSDLLRKVSYLNVALQLEQDRSAVPYVGVIEQPNIPTSPSFPKLRIMLGLGALVGVLLGVFHVLLKEIERSSSYLPEEVSRAFGVPYFGRLELVDGEMPTSALLDAPQKFLAGPHFPSSGPSPDRGPVAEAG